MIDLDAIKGRANSAYLLDRDDGDALFAAMGDVKALVAEVERLRDDIDAFYDDFRRVTSETCAPDELHCSCVPHLRAQVAELRALGVSLHKSAAMGRDAERAAVVAWLRERQPGWPAGSGGHADAIERGEHRREEER